MFQLDVNKLQLHVSKAKKVSFRWEYHIIINSFLYCSFLFSHRCLGVQSTSLLLAYAHPVRIALSHEHYRQKWMVASSAIQDARFVLFGTC